MRSRKGSRLIRNIVIVLLAMGAIGLIFALRPTKEPGQVSPPTKEPYQSLPEGYKNGVWTWESPQKMNQKKLEEQMKFAQEKEIKIIYLFLEDYISLKEGTSGKKQDQAINSFNEDVKTFIAAANAHDIEVHALAGAPNWADSSYRYLAPTLVDYVIAFNSNTNQKEKFAGVQFDIEFYNKDSYKKNKAEAIDNYLNLVAELAQKIKEDGQNSISLGFAIPYWFDEGKGNAPKVTFQDKKQTVLEHLLDSLEDTNSYLALMAYRSRTQGHNGSINLVKGDLALADKKKSDVKMYVGLETEKNEKGVTFYSKKGADVTKAAHEISAAFAQSPSFSGVAIHTLAGYRNLDRK